MSTQCLAKTGRFFLADRGPSRPTNGARMILECPLEPVQDALAVGNDGQDMGREGLGNRRLVRILSVLFQPLEDPLQRGEFLADSEQVAAGLAERGTS